MPGQIKVAVDIRDLRIAKTGVKTYLEELVAQFNLQDSAAFKFYFFDTSFPVYTGRNKILKLIEHFRFLFWKQLTLPFKAWINRCDIIFCADFFVPFFSPGAKTIPVLHDAFFFEYPQHYNKFWLYLFKTVGMAAARKAATIITPTQYTKKRISELSGIAPHKIEVVYEGPKTFIKGVAASVNPLPESPYILHVGVIEKRKNLLNLLKAYKMILPDFPEIKLVLIGQFSPKSDMDDREAIKGFIEENNLSAQVCLPGYVPDEALSNWYRHAALYVFPSINEGFGIPVLEAFAHELPLLIADNSCLPEVAGDAAIRFDPFKPGDIAEKIKMLLNDNSLQEALKLKGSQRALKFKWSIAAAALLKIFKDVAEKKPIFNAENNPNA